MGHVLQLATLLQTFQNLNPIFLSHGYVDYLGSFRIKYSGGPFDRNFPIFVLGLRLALFLLLLIGLYYVDCCISRFINILDNLDTVFLLAHLLGVVVGFSNFISIFDFFGVRS